MYKTFRFRMYPNDNQTVLINKTFGCYRFIYNYFLNICKENGFSSAFDMIRKLPSLREEYDIIISEKLDIKRMKHKSNLSKNILDASFNKICSHCGEKTDKTNNLEVRKWECSKCHSINDRDINSSINIMFEGLKYCFD